MVIQPQKGDQRDRIMFEVSKADVSLMLEKLSIIVRWCPSPTIRSRLARNDLCYEFNNLLNNDFRIYY